MNKNSWNLSEEEVRQIGRIIDTLNQTTFDYLQIEIGDFRLTLSKGPVPAAPAEFTGGSANTQDGAAAMELSTAPPAVMAAQTVKSEADQQGGTVAIVSPMIGRFYLQPEPGAPPFVAVGSKVSDESTVGLIEVMKTFNAVHAGITGVITEICAPDTALVEYGQVLFRVQPEKNKLGQAFKGA